MIKVCLLSLGILIGLYFPEYLKDLTALWWVLFVGGAAYFIVKMVREDVFTD